ncbi:hypothetical protein [Embleya sp. NPDC020886]|uniref:hypothetical protein n=1 Tax=Embleya sp. NPDC020886 TaxID=3363980 RepID=UPI003797B6F5
MPTPHGDQGMAFSAHEVRVLCRALTAALRGGRDAVDFWLLGRAIAEAQDERDRLRVFMTAELRRYRAAMPGSAAGFLSCLRNAVDEVAHIPSAEDLAALRSTVDLPCGEHERASRVALLHRCTHLAEAALEQRLTARAHRRATARSARPDPLDILIPTRPRPAFATPPAARPTAPEPAATPEPAPAPAPREATHGPVDPHEAAAPDHESAVHETAAPPSHDLLDPEAAEPAAAESEGPAGEITERVVSARESAESEAAPHRAAAEETTADESPRGEPPAPEPAEAEDIRPRSAEPEADAGTDPDDPAPARETLSPVIPHRRQGRVLGQLPAPEVLQTGTG